MAEDTPVDTPKRKRGRPPKAESEKVAPKRKAESDDVEEAPKRGRGRPKGTKKKGSVASKKPAPTGTSKRGRGRPPKNPPKEEASEEEAEDAE